MEENKRTEDENNMPTEFIFTDDDFNGLFAAEKEKHNTSENSSHVRHREHARRTKTIKNRRSTKGAKQRKMDLMTKRIHELQTEIQILKGKNFCDRCRSSIGISNSLSRAFSEKCTIQETKQPAKLQMFEAIDQPFSREFEQFQIEGMTPTPGGEEEMNLSGQVWIVMGLLMMLMGVNINGFDGTIDVYKITKQTVDYLRKQVEKSAQTIVLPVFFSKVFSLEGSLGVTNQIANEGFELEGLRLESIDQEELMFEEHVNFHLKYEALIVMMEYMKQYASIK